jgi:HD-GYP domain-containing protein (c-di-GMP phosphodiesterase class II)
LEDEKQQSNYLATLFRANYYLGHVTSLDEMLQAILEDTGRTLDAQQGSVVLWDETTGQFTPRAVSITGPGAVRSTNFNPTLVQQAFHQGHSLLSTATGTAAAVICALLRSPRKRLGVLQLDRGPDQQPFTKDDLRLADAIATTVSAGIESAQLVESQRTLFLQTVTAMAQMVEVHDLYTGGHIQRVTDYALLLAKELGLPIAERRILEIGTPLHDIGKIAIDTAILRKPGRLTAGEFEQMKAHTYRGAEILAVIPDFKAFVPIVRHHHERWDGRGYPDALTGDRIPFMARIVAVADAFDAMTSHRPYRPNLSVAQAFAEIAAGAGSHFDPACVQAMLRLRPHFERLFLERKAVTETLIPHEGTSPVEL